MKNKTVIQRVKGSLLGLRGSLKPKSVPEDLEKVREQVKKKVAARDSDEEFCAKQSD